MEFTVEQLNYFRVCNIALSIVPEGLRTIFKQEWDTLYTATPHGQWNDTPVNFTSFFAMESTRNRSRNNRNLGNMTSGDRREWDCTCLFYAIMYSDSVGPTLSTTVKNNIDVLREIRNEVAHNNDASLTEADFQASIQKITTAFNVLNLDTTKVNEMKHQTSFPTKELNNINQELDNIKLELKNIKKDLEDETKRNAQPSCFCVLPPKPSHDTIDRMEEVGRIYEKMNRLSSEKKGETTMVYLSGNPGCGKSVLARQIGEKHFDDTTAELKFITTINASNMDTLFQSYVDFAGRLNCHPDCITNIATSKDLSKENQIIQLKALADKQVAKYSSWLMIVDNVTDLKSFSKYWPQSELSVPDMENSKKVSISKVKDILKAVKHSDHNNYIGDIPHHETNDSVGGTLQDLGLIFYKLGQYDQSKTYYEKALAISKTAYDENHPLIGQILQNLGRTFHQLGQYDKAKTYYEKP
ncbi:hypothetical protein QZH41_009176 [Actinostola sp. cb2023]|nr:hypothetical protein QZH41_009176 [Actinostola sp. cb2023]